MNTSNVILRVAVPVKLYTLLDYILPSDIDSSKLKPGTRVLIPFLGKEKVGVVVDTTNETALAAHKIKPIFSLLEDSINIPSETLWLVQWASTYYQFPIGLSLQVALPKFWLKNSILPDLPISAWGFEPEKIKEISPQAKQQHLIITFIKQHGQLYRSDLAIHNLSSSAFKTLVKKAILIPKQGRSDSNWDLKARELELNHEQQTCIDKFNQLSILKPILLEGVTGSGKTEVFLQITHKVIQKGQQVLILVPEIGLTPQTLKRFTDRFNCGVGLLHSNMTDKQRYNEWLSAIKGSTQIIIGTRSAIFTPFKALGLIVVDEEHDLSYKQQDSLRYSARDLAVVRAQHLAIPVILSSATPSLETTANALHNRYHHWELKKRAGEAEMPHILIEDIRNKNLSAGLCESSLLHMSDHLKRNQQVLIFLNRRGYASATLCHHCGWSLTCSACDANMTFYQHKQRSLCHHCGHAQSTPRQCPACGSMELKQAGIGTEQIAEGMKEIFPTTRLFQIDRDTTSNQNQMNDTLTKIQSCNKAILIGTQMLAKGHHFPKVTLVVIVNTDNALMSADFRAKERFAQLITQVIGRAGRSEQPGSAIIQTHYPQHDQLLALVKKGYACFAKSILAERQQLHLPPFAFMALITLESQTPSEALSILQKLRIQSSIDQVHILGPFPAGIAKRAHFFRYQLILKSHKREWLRKTTTKMRKLSTELIPSRVRFYIDIDPQDMA